MKLRIILSSLLIILISATFSTTANATPWRHERYERHGHCRPIVRYCPPVRVYAPPVQYYSRPAYYAPRCYNEHRRYRHGCRW